MCRGRILDVNSAGPCSAGYSDTRGCSGLHSRKGLYNLCAVRDTNVDSGRHVFNVDFFGWTMGTNDYNLNLAVSNYSSSGCPQTCSLHRSDKLGGTPETWFFKTKLYIMFNPFQWDKGALSSFFFLFDQVVGSQMPNAAPAAPIPLTPKADAQANGRGRLETMLPHRTWQGCLPLQNFLGNLATVVQHHCFNAILFRCDLSGG